MRIIICVLLLCAGCVRYRPQPFTAADTTTVPTVVDDNSQITVLASGYGETRDAALRTSRIDLRRELNHLVWQRLTIGCGAWLSMPPEPDSILDTKIARLATPAKDSIAPNPWPAPRWEWGRTLYVLRGREFKDIARYQLRYVDGDTAKAAKCLEAGFRN